MPSKRLRLFSKIHSGGKQAYKHNNGSLWKIQPGKFLFTLFPANGESVSSSSLNPLRLNFAGLFFFFLFQNVLFFDPKGILNQAKMTPGFTTSSRPPQLPLLFFFFFLDKAEFILRCLRKKNLYLILWGVFFVFIHFLRVLRRYWQIFWHPQARHVQNDPKWKCWCWWQSFLMGKLRSLK